jgi:hypothetical protein
MSDLDYVSCGCIWDGTEQIRVCPAHNRNRDWTKRSDMAAP